MTHWQRSSRSTKKLAVDRELDNKCCLMDDPAKMVIETAEKTEVAAMKVGKALAVFGNNGTLSLG